MARPHGTRAAEADRYHLYPIQHSTGPDMGRRNGYYNTPHGKNPILNHIPSISPVILRFLNTYNERHYEVMPMSCLRYLAKVLMRIFVSI